MRLHTLGRLAGLATLLLALAGTTRTAAAQTGSNVDVLTGTITDTTGTPIAGAVVEAYSLETQVTRKTTTNARGRYTIFFNDGGGQYRVTVTMVGRTPWIANLALDPATRSNTSVCLKIVDPAIARLPEDAQRAFIKRMEALLDTEKAAHDVAGHRDAPPHLRIWCGSTVETADVAALTPWLEWAFAEAKAGLAEAA